MARRSESDRILQVLVGKPTEVSVSLASRAALRTLPLVATKMGPSTPRTLHTSTIEINFAACAIASAAARWPSRRHELCDAAEKLCIRAALEPYRFADGPGYVVINAVRAMMATDSKASAAMYSARALQHSVAVLIGSIAPTMKSPDLWAKLSASAYATLEPDLRAAKSASDCPKTLVAEMAALCCRPIWDSVPPQRITQKWIEFSAELLHADQSWQRWIAWYEQVANGTERCETRELEAISRLVFDRSNSTKLR